MDPVPALSRIASLRSALPVPLGRAPQDSAQLLRLVLGLGAAGEMVSSGDQGQVYRLSDGTPPQNWQPGQTMLVRVLRTGPPLEIQVLGTSGPDTRTPRLLHELEIEPPALRPDQAAILRLAAASTDTMALAAHWRQLVLEGWRKATTFAPTPIPISSASDRPLAVPLDQVMLLRYLPWHSWPLTLWVEQRRWSGGAERRARRRAGARLCLSVTLAPWGTLALVLDVLDTQVGLTLLAVDGHALPSLRAQVGAIAARLARAGLQLKRCNVQHAPDFAVPKHAALTSAAGNHELPLALFRAGSEALEALRRASDALAS